MAKKLFKVTTSHVNIDAAATAIIVAGESASSVLDEVVAEFIKGSPENVLDGLQFMVEAISPAKPADAPAEKQFTFKVKADIRGMTFNSGVKRLLRYFHPGNIVVLVPEPSNPIHSNAVRAETIDGVKLGYLGREWADEYANFFATQAAVSAKVVEASDEGHGKLVVAFEVPYNH